MKNMRLKLCIVLLPIIASCASNKKTTSALPPSTTEKQVGNTQPVQNATNQTVAPQTTEVLYDK